MFKKCVALAFLTMALTSMATPPEMPVRKAKGEKPVYYTIENADGKGYLHADGAKMGMTTNIGGEDAMWRLESHKWDKQPDHGGFLLYNRSAKSYFRPVGNNNGYYFHGTYVRPWYISRGYLKENGDSVISDKGFYLTYFDEITADNSPQFLERNPKFLACTWDAGQYVPDCAESGNALWVFHPVDMDAAFVRKRDAATAMLGRYLASVPFGADELLTIRKNISEYTYAGFESDYDRAADQVEIQMNTAIGGLANKLFMSLPGKSLIMKSVGRNAVVSAVVNGDGEYQLSTSAGTMTWTFIVADGNKWKIRDANGTYIGKMPSAVDKPIGVTTSESEAGVYDIGLSDGAIILAANNMAVTFPEGDGVAMSGALGAQSAKIAMSIPNECPLPQFSTASAPVYYLVRNINSGRYLSYVADRNPLQSKPESSEQAYWWIEKRSNGAVVFHSKSNPTIYVYASGAPYTFNGFKTDLYLLDRIMEGDAPVFTAPKGYFISTASRLDEGTTYILSDNERADFGVEGSAFKYVKEKGLWEFVPVNGADLAELQTAQKAAVEELSRVMASIPWGKKEFTTAIAAINAVNLSDYKNVLADALAKVQTLKAEGVASGIAAAQKEANGKTASLSNVKRQERHDPDAGWFLSTEKPQAQDGVATTTMVNIFSTWEFTSTASGKLNICDGNSMYIMPFSGENAPVKMTASKNAAGEFEFAVVNNHIVVKDASGLVLMADNEGSDVKSAKVDAAGIEWIITTAIKKLPGMPVVSTHENPILYVVRNVGRPNEVLTGYEDRTASAHSKLSRGGYWYFVEGGDGSVMLVNHLHRTYLSTFANSTLWCYNQNTLNTNASTTNPRWYIVPNGVNDKGFVISSTPTPGNLCVSTVPQAGFQPQECGLGNPAKGWEATTWTFEQTEINEEAIFIGARDEKIAYLSSYLGATPWGQEELKAHIDRIANTPMSKYGSNSNDAVAVLSGDIAAVERELQNIVLDKADGCTVTIFSRLRRGNATEGAYLTSDAEGQLNTTNSVSASSTWTIEYASNNRFYICNQNGEYIQPLRSGMGVTKSKSEAGRYFIRTQRGSIMLLNAGDEATALSIDGGSGVAGPGAVANSGGTHWGMSLSNVGGIDSPEVDDAPVEIYNLQGVRIENEALVPGIYIMVKNGVSRKVVIK